LRLCDAIERLRLREELGADKDPETTGEDVVVVAWLRVVDDDDAREVKTFGYER